MTPGQPQRDEVAPQAIAWWLWGGCCGRRSARWFSCRRRCNTSCASPTRHCAVVGRLDPDDGASIDGRGRKDATAVSHRDGGGELGIAEDLSGILPRVDSEVDLFKVLNTCRGENDPRQFVNELAASIGREEFNPGECGLDCAIHCLGGVSGNLAEKAGQTLNGLGPARVACSEAEIEVGGVAAAQHHVVAGEVGYDFFGLSEKFGEGALDNLDQFRISE